MMLGTNFEDGSRDITYESASCPLCPKTFSHLGEDLAEALSGCVKGDVADEELHTVVGIEQIKGGSRGRFPPLDDARHVFPVPNVPIRLGPDALPLLHPPEPYECSRRWLGLGVSGAVAKHNYGFMTLLLCNFSEGGGLAAVARRGLGGVEARVGAGCVVIEEDGVSEDVGLGDIEFLSDGLDHDAELQKDDKFC